MRMNYRLVQLILLAFTALLCACGDVGDSPEPDNVPSLAIVSAFDTVMDPTTSIAQNGVALHTPDLHGKLSGALPSGMAIEVFDTVDNSVVEGTVSITQTGQTFSWQFESTYELDAGPHALAASIVDSDNYALATSNTWAFSLADLDPAYGAALAFNSQDIVGGGTALMSVKVSNQNSGPVYPELTVTFPSGFTQDSFQNNSCGGSVSSTLNVVRLTGANVGGGASCTFAFEVHIPADATAMNYSIANNNGSNLLGLTAGGSFTWPESPSALDFSQLDIFITPLTDPGPASDVFWAGQIFSLNGYTGLQSPVLGSDTSNEGSGKQFLFSLWADENLAPGTLLEVKTGTPASAGIGGGSFCNADSTTADGANGAQCRFRYNWVVGHTYRFRVTPIPFDPSANTGGPGWYQSAVTDVTPSEPNPVTFVIGQINTFNGKTLIPNTAVDTWIEYFDWNDTRTTCTSSAYSQFKVHVEAKDALGKKYVPVPSKDSNSSCPGGVSTSLDSSTNSITMTINQDQTAQGLIKTTQGGDTLCLSGVQQDNVPSNSNTASLDPCPSEEDVLRDGGASYAYYLWVMAADHTIQLAGSYCLTNDDPQRAASAVFIQSCSAGAKNQQWQWNPNSPTDIQAGAPGTNSGMCLTGVGQGDTISLSLASCTTNSRPWSIPGKTFAY
jgi:hypothetical protein